MPIGEKLKTVKCPKCKKIVTEFLEYWTDMTIQFDDDVLLGRRKPCLNMDGTGYPYKVEAQCDCGHQWRLKKITQIDQLLID